jgi:hypothetical protein
MIQIGAYYRNVKLETLLVQVKAVVNGAVIVTHIGELEAIGKVPYPMEYFVNNYELDG